MTLGGFVNAIQARREPSGLKRGNPPSPRLRSVKVWTSYRTTSRLSCGRGRKGEAGAGGSAFRAVGVESAKASVETPLNGMAEDPGVAEAATDGSGEATASPTGGELSPRPGSSLSALQATVARASALIIRMGLSGELIT